MTHIATSWYQCFWLVVCQFLYRRRDKQSHLQTPLKHYLHCWHGWPAGNKNSTIITVTTCAVFQPRDHRKANPGNICCLSVKVCPWWLDSYTFWQRRLGLFIMHQLIVHTCIYMLIYGADIYLYAYKLPVWCKALDRFTLQCITSAK